MADYLPLNEKDLLKINGFGPAKVENTDSNFYLSFSAIAPKTT